MDVVISVEGPTLGALRRSLMSFERYGLKDEDHVQISLDLETGRPATLMFYATAADGSGIDHEEILNVGMVTDIENK